METAKQQWRGKTAPMPAKMSDAMFAGIMIGIVMPIISGLVYPTYYHKMPVPWVEWTRLMEAPFLLCELLFLRLAMHRGMDLTALIRSQPKDIKVAAILLITGVFASSILFSQQPAQSLVISIATIVHLLFAFSIYFIFSNAKDEERRFFLKCLGFGLLPLAFFTAWRFLFPVPASSVPGGTIEWMAALPGFINVRHFGSWTGAVAMVFVAIIVQRGDKARLSWMDGFYFAAAGMTIWSGTRAAILAIILATLIMIVSRKKMLSLAMFGRLSLLTGGAAILAFLLIPYNNPAFMLFPLGEVENSSGIASGRIELWKATYASWTQSPLLGWGSGSTFWEVYAGWPHTQPHNAVLQFLISWGIVGAAGAIWLLGRAVIAAHRKVASRSPELWPLLACLYALLVMSMLEGMLHYPRFIMLIFAMMALILASKEDGRQINSR